MPIEFAVKKRVTLPLLKMDDNGTPIFVQILTKIEKAKENPEVRTRTTKDGAAMAPPELCQVINLETGEEAQIIVPVVLASELREAYPNDSYVGRQFKISKFKNLAGKRYSTFQIAEIEVRGHRPPATTHEALKPVAAEQRKQVGKR